ncbi:Cna protein B-type domain-containing protein [Ruminococcus sp. YE71]|uniref:SpaA isopeptide-forming pilin-related protein n=1 Tax=Ruminococcus sp. YE71 TaxID=244362 RepID=UPI000908E171|nr:SpaA isopeptide-forming pilin-related protein [Ruminococcus sp. YE71]SFW50906.1 Cna protein B-type domain-containing protein [Ruminococcus sp. YE71]
MSFKFSKLAKRICSSVMAGLTAFSIIGSSLPVMTVPITAAAAEDKIEFPTSDEFISKACELLGTKYTLGGKGASDPWGNNKISSTVGTGGTLYSASDVKKYGVDCTGIIYWSMRQLGLSSTGYIWQAPVPVDTEHWLYDSKSQRITSASQFHWYCTKNGITVEEVEKTVKNAVYNEDYANTTAYKNATDKPILRPYWEDENGKTLAPGSIIFGEGYYANGSSVGWQNNHAWIYLGEFANREMVIEKLVSKWGVSQSVAEKCTIDTGNGSTHWRLEATSAVRNGISGVMVDNANDGKVASAMSVTGYDVFYHDLEFKKVNSDSALVAGYSSTSSLANAKCTYGIYTSESNAKSDTNRVAVLEIGADGSGSLSLPYSANGYYAKELTAPAGFKVSSHVYKLDYSNVNEFEDDNEVGSITINKNVESTKAANVTFVVEGGGKTYTKSAKIKNNGTIEFNDLPVYSYARNADNAIYAKSPITYKVTETISVADDGAKFILPATWSVCLADYANADFTVAHKFVNKETSGNLNVTKNFLDQSGHTVDISTVDASEINFVIYNEDKSKIVKASKGTDGKFIYLDMVNGTPSVSNSTRFVVSANGKLSIANLPAGTYILHEISGIENNYTPAEDIQFTIIAGKTASIPVSNWEVSSNATVEKRVIDIDGELLYDEDQLSSVYRRISFKAHIVGGKYIIAEKLSDGVYSYVGLADSAAKGTNFLLDYNKESDLFGKAILNNIPNTDDIVFEENDLPGDMCNSERTSATSHYSDGVRTTAVITNSYKYIEASFTKKDADSGNDITGGLFGLYANEDIVVDGVTKFVKDEEIEVIPANGGVNAFAAKLPAGKRLDITVAEGITAYRYVPYQYYIKEITAPDGYVPDDTKHIFSCSKNIEMTFTQIGTPFSTENVDLTNELILGQVNIIKTDADTNEPIKGAKFDLFRFGETTAFTQLVTDENGRATVKDLPLGKYSIAETDPAAPYYLPKNAVRTFELTTDMLVAGTRYAVADYHCKNNKQKVKLTVYKKCAETNKYLEGAVFEILDGNKIIDTITTDANGIAVNNTTLYADKEYTLSEKTPPTGYYDTGYSEKFKADYTDKTIEYTEIVKSVENTPTNIIVSKKTLTGEDELPGATLVVLDMNENIIDKWESTSEEHKIIGKLVPGESYILRETQSPNGYTVAEDVEFTVNLDGTVQHVEMRDAQTEVRITKYDSETNEPLKGAVLQILDGTKVVDEWTSTNKAHVIAAKLIAGKEYVLHEVSAPKGYCIAPDQMFTVSTDGTIDKISMKDKPTDVFFEKKDDEGNNIPGATLQVIGPDGEVIKEWVTDEYAYEIKAELESGLTYTLHEKTAPKGYYLAADVTFTVSTDGTKDHVVMIEKPTVVIFSKKSLTGDDELPGAEMWVTDENGTIYDKWISTNEPHIVKAMLEVGKTYYLHEEVAPKGYCLADDIKFKVSTDGSATLITMNDKPTHVEILKTDDEGNPVIGAALELYNMNGELIDGWITTEYAYVIEAELEAGIQYRLHEADVPKGYTLAADIYFTVSTDGSIDEIIMLEKPTIVSFSKKSLTGEDELPGAEMWVTDETGAIYDKWISTTKPHIVKAMLEAGKEYILHEEVAPVGYVVADDIKFKVSEDGSVDIVTMYDTPTSIEITKYDADTGKALAGAVLQIIDPDDMSVIEEWTSTEEAHTIVAVLMAGKEYILHEVSAPENYELADDVTFIVSTDGSIDTISMSDVQKKGNVEIHKTTEGMLNLGGIKFTLSGTSDFGTEVSIESVTNDDGIAYFDHIPVGTYVITEDGETAPYAYLVADAVEVNVMYAETSIVEIYNDEKKGSIEVHKTTEGMTDLGGIRFVLEGTSDSGREIMIDAVTDDNGIALFENIPIGTYVITEDGDTVPTAYMVAEPESVEVFYAETTTKEIFNDLKTGSIEIVKKTEGQFNIEGIEFILEGTSDNGKEVSVSGKTDENGKVTFINVPVGTYTITENGETVPTAYLVAEPETVEVFYAETTIKEIFNGEKTGTFSVQKKTEGMTNLSGIDFVLEGTSDSGREISITATTDEKGLAEFGEIPVGTYTITEVGSTVPAGYLVAAPETVEIFYAETTVKEIKNEETKIEISKQDATTGKELPGAHLKLVDKDGNTIDEWVSTTEVHKIYGKLKAGETYTLVETMAPDGYLIATAVTFTVNSDGTVQKVVMKDEHKPTDSSKPDTPTTNTGTPNTDTPNPSTGTAAGTVVILASACALVFFKRKK